MTSAIDISAAALAAAARPLTGGPGDYDALLQLVGDARFVLIGEATHGTHEFYEERARITQRLIREKGFTAVAVEADWPDAYRVNRYVRGQGQDGSANEALSGFERFPSWMWRNTDVERFVDWLRTHNEGSGADAQVGFYGLDLYSLFTSVREVLNYLEEVDPQAAAEARQRYACFDHYGEDSQQYGYAAGIGLSESCQKGVLTQLAHLQASALDYMQADGGSSEDAFFYAQQNARLVKNAEEYYRTMFRGRVSSWNLRDSHMAETLDALAKHLSRDGTPAKIVIWEHNSHIGDARATYMGGLGEWNLGELARKAYPGETCLIGFSTYDGHVTAASEWDGPAEHKRVRPAMPGSYEELLHHVGLPRYYLNLRDDSSVRRIMLERRLERAIGVLYLPRSERQSHYFDAKMAEQFDAIIHIDRTEALVPLDATSGWHSGEPPETYPEGI
ncbi:erythromycin esterase family protein [Massilia sp. Dwa41.01b]|uniref:erythromycin esterase family protein n=1 Tax=unclassified Massilia TaxID=2609279 RepID=UPI00160461D2|nr:MULTISPECIES: erythromycin esterase family protein [unclassified Massilia]QNA89470.1 erythromycin esterase family protein [Massilia sp. Dwa41.01b]QNB00375.1 erythromycin esterase family protein [Massilia sp. Se16.2.3]